MKRGIAIGWLFVLAVFLYAPAQASEQDDILKANQLYMQKEYEKAARLYEALIAGGLHNGYLYYNLGNAYSRLGRPGPAILNFLKAKELLPRDPSLDANLKYTLRQTTDQISLPPEGVLKTVFFWADACNLKEHLKLILVLHFLFWIVLALWLQYRTGTLNWARKAVLAALLIAVCAGAVRLLQNPYADSGVVLAGRIDVKSAQGNENVTLFQLHEGAIIAISEEKNGWYRIVLTPDKTGWVPRESIGT